MVREPSTHSEENDKGKGGLIVQFIATFMFFL